MRINIVAGFFLPMPPDAGGAVEKSWYGLARELVAQGHEVTILSRRWRGWPDREKRDGIVHRRIRGHNHTGSLPRNLWLDLLWSLRAASELPAADITIANCVSLPVWLPFLRRAGKVAVSTGRMPKGQYRWYGRVDLVLAASTPVRDAVVAENPRLAARIRICGYPIRWSELAQPRAPRTGPVVIGFVGRIHREKGLDLFTAAVEILAKRPDLPPWRVVFCGPADIPRGGSGPAYAEGLRQRMRAALGDDRFELRAPEFDEARLASLYRTIDVFCYPSVATHGETFGVAVAEAMAAGAVPVVSSLACFADFVRHDESGLVVDMTAAGAPGRLADAIAGLVRMPERRAALASAAAGAVERYDYPAYARRLVSELAPERPGDRSSA